MLRKATMEDVPFIVDLIEYDSAHGHYLPYPRELVAGDMYSIATNEERMEDGNRATAWIWELNEVPVGFVIVQDIPRQVVHLFPKKAHELYMISVAPEHRKQGHGEKMLREIQSKAYKWFARCRQPSTACAYLLLKTGFIEQNRSFAEERLFATFKLNF